MFTPQPGIQDACELFWPHLHPLAPTPRPLSALHHPPAFRSWLSLPGSASVSPQTAPHHHSWGSQAARPTAAPGAPSTIPGRVGSRTVDAHLADTQLPAHLNPLRLDKGNGWPGGPETPPPPSACLQVSEASEEPPRGPQVHLPPLPLSQLLQFLEQLEQGDHACEPCPWESSELESEE